MQQIENLTQTVQEKIPVVKETIESQIPVVKSKFDDTISFCKSKFISPEDKAEIYALYTNEEKPEENLEDPLKSQPEFQSINLEGINQNQLPQNINTNAPRQIDDKEYIKELIDICNENG